MAAASLGEVFSAQPGLVEGANDEVPDTMPASVNRTNADLPAAWSKERTGPVCPWPAYAKYEGGDAEKASSFICARQCSANPISFCSLIIPRAARRSWR